MIELEFTFDWYRTLLRELQSKGFTFRSYGDEMAAGDVLLRHDVDLSPHRAVEVARIEHEMGAQSTYFFLVTTPLYNSFHRPVRDAITEIADLGHDIGLHFSTHQYWHEDDPPDEETLATHVRSELEVLSTISPEIIPTISFHIPPSWVLERRFEGFASTYEPRYFNEISYLADSGQRWRDEPFQVPSPTDPLQLLTHPGLWGREDRSFVERIQEAVAESDERVSSYASSRYLESESESERPRLPGILDV